MAVFAQITAVQWLLFTSPPKAVPTCADNITQVCVSCQFQFFNISHFDRRAHFKDFEIEKEF